MIEFATWIVKLLAIATMGLICYSICLAVNYKMIAKMVVLVSVMVAISVSFQFITPQFNRTSNYIKKQEQKLERTQTTVEEIERYTQKINPATPIEDKPKSKNWLEILLFGN